LACNKVCKLAGCSNPILDCSENYCEEHLINRLNEQEIKQIKEDMED
jgi:hypothetical protein